MARTGHLTRVSDFYFPLAPSVSEHTCLISEQELVTDGITVIGVVSRASYHAHNLTIRLHAEKSTWRKVTRSYVIDFGEVSRRLPKRAFDFNGDGVFTLDLASSWPRTFFNQTWDGTKFTVSCADCGTRGSLVFAGHIGKPCSCCSSLRGVSFAIY